jgi:hypothetical protein
MSTAETTTEEGVGAPPGVGGGSAERDSLRLDMDMCVRTVTTLPSNGCFIKVFPPDSLLLIDIWVRAQSLVYKTDGSF